MKISLAIHFLAKKYVEIVSKFVSCKKIGQIFLNKHSGKVNCLAKMHYCTAI